MSHAEARRGRERREDCKMAIEEIQRQLSEAWHEIGHAQEQVGRGCYLAAWLDAGRALRALNAAHDALEKIQA